MDQKVLKHEGKNISFGQNYPSTQITSDWTRVRNHPWVSDEPSAMFETNIEKSGIRYKKTFKETAEDKAYNAECFGGPLQNWI